MPLHKRIFFGLTLGVFPALWIAALLYKLFNELPSENVTTKVWVIVLSFASVLSLNIGVTIWIALRNLELMKRPIAVFVGLYAISTSGADLILLFAMWYKDLGLWDGNTLTHNPADCLYFSLITWTTLGYGDIRPSAAARAIAATEAMSGYLFMGLYLAFMFQALSFLATYWQPRKSG
jgi:Ion channel